MNITQIAFHYRKPVFLVLLILITFGAYSYFTMPAREDPQIAIREAVVITQYPGLSQVRVENLITRKLEQAIRKIPEVKTIRSTSSTGLSVIHVEILNEYDDLKSIWQRLRNKVNDAQSQLPSGTLPSSVNDDFGDVAVITLALTSEGFDLREMNEMARHTANVLYTVKGTKRIEVLGAQQERIYLEISNARLSRLGITPAELVGTLQNQNIIQPGGLVDTGTTSFIIEPSGNFTSIDDIGETLIALPGTNNVIPLKDVMTIKRDYIDPPVNLSYYNGKPAIILAISMLDGENVLEFSPRMKAKIDEIQGTLPHGIDLNIATYQADQVTATINGVSISVIQTLLIVLAVVMLFLGIRTGMIVGAIVPFVMLVTLAIMNFSGLELQRLSLATLIISLGLLVDNGIVIAEDFKRRLEAGINRDEALKTCGKELAVPLFISTLTTILVFMPLMLANHAAGEFTRSISLVIMISLLTSWLLALTVTPVLCYFYLKIDAKKDSESIEKPNRLTDFAYQQYKKWLHGVLAHRTLFSLAMLGLLFMGIGLMSLVPQQFFPDSDRNQILVYIELESSTTTRTTNRRMQSVFEHLDRQDGLKTISSYAAYVGYGGPRFVLTLAPEDPSPNKGFMVLNIDNPDDMDATIKALRELFQTHFPDMLVRVTKMFLGSSDSSEIDVQVTGHDTNVLYNTAEKIKTIFRDIPNTIDIRSSWENPIIKVNVIVDQQRARRAGITSRDIALSMHNAFDGMRITNYREDDNIIPVIIRIDQGERFNLDLVRTINVYSTSRQTSVPLFQIANFSTTNEFAKIDRTDMFRTISVRAKNLDTTAEDMKTVIDDRIQALNATMPINHKIGYSGVVVDSSEAAAALSANIPMVFAIIILLLVIQFNSYGKPVIILATIPLIITGAAVGMLVTKSYFGFMVTLGLYSLAGIIINNAIVLIDRIAIEEARGLSTYDAIVQACVVRLRPIIMTTITTILGFLPLILSQDPLFYGMANAMAFGLGLGTVMTLFVVPVLYALLYRVKRPT